MLIKTVTSALLATTIFCYAFAGNPSQLCQDISKYSLQHNLANKMQSGIVLDYCSAQKQTDWKCVEQGLKNGNRLGFSENMCFSYKNPEIYKGAQENAQKYCLKSMKGTALSNPIYCLPDAIEKSPSQLKCVVDLRTQGDSYDVATDKCFNTPQLKQGDK
jgi:hypothetical protein